MMPGAGAEAGAEGAECCNVRTSTLFLSRRAVGSGPWSVLKFMWKRFRGAFEAAKHIEERKHGLVQSCLFLGKALP